MSKIHKHHYIYKIICILSNKYYIGMHSTSNLKDGYFGSGKVLKRSINKHGKENHQFEILEFLPDRNSLKAREAALVNESLLADPMCMNLQLGGGGGFISTEHQLKCSAAGGKTNNPEKSKKASAKMTETNDKRIASGTHLSWKKTYDRTGKPHTPETCEKIGAANSIKQKGSGNSQFGTKWVTHEEFGNAKIKLAELNQYLSNGYSLGRVLSK